MFTQEQITRFWGNVNKGSNGECWNWKLSTDHNGYGKVKIGQKLYISHRVAYEICNRKPSDGFCILHSCDNPICCNPSHLREGTHKENMQDMIIRGRQAREFDCGKLTKELAEQLRQDFSEGLSKHELSRKYNISCRSVRDILKRLYWK